MKIPNTPLTRQYNLWKAWYLGVTLLCGPLLAGCAVGPDYTISDNLKLPKTEWHHALPHQGKVINLAVWWQQFDDPVLAQLIDVSEKNSPTLEAALARVKQARASSDAAKAGLLPTLSASGSSTRSRTGSSGSTRTQTTQKSSLDAGWEIDLFGGKRRAKEQAYAQWESRQALWHDARVTLAAEVAMAYADARECQVVFKTQQDRVASQQVSRDLSVVELQTGLVDTAEADVAEAAYQSALNGLATQQSLCAQKQNLIAELVAQPVAKVADILATSSPSVPMARGGYITDVSASLLSQRPDVAAAERSMAAASAAIGVAKADLYPSLSLTGALGVVKTLGTSAVTSWSFGPALNLPLFRGGALKAEVTRAQAAYDEAKATYRSTVLAAVKEVEDALARVNAAATRMEAANIAAQKYADYCAMQEVAFHVGRLSLADVEDARRSAYTAKDTLAATQLEYTQAWIALYKALGGGWQGTETIETRKMG